MTVQKQNIFNIAVPFHEELTVYARDTSYKLDFYNLDVECWPSKWQYSMITTRILRPQIIGYVNKKIKFQKQMFCFKNFKHRFKKKIRNYDVRVYESHSQGQ